MTLPKTYLCLIVCGIVLLFAPSYGQTASFRRLEEKVYKLNNALKYNESQALLLPVLQSEAFSDDEKYQASLLLSYTYKRVMDYAATLQFLETARRFGRQTAKKDQYLAAVMGQKAMVYFDIHQYQKADSLMKGLEKTHFRYIDLENKSKLVMQQGYLLFLARQYAEAETTYDKAIGWMRASSPCDLPMIYVKKMQLYAAMNRMDLLAIALGQSTRSADSCAIIKYNIYAQDELRAIYKKRNDIAGIAATTRTLDSLNEIYARAENIAALHNQKETMLLGAQDQRLTTEHNRGKYLTLFAVGLLLTIMILAGLLWVYRRHQANLEADISRMKADLEQYLRLNKAAPANGVTLENKYISTLSERQVDVLNCMTKGLSNREIADRLFISENTVKYHIKNIYQLLEIKDRKELLVNHHTGRN